MHSITDIFWTVINVSCFVIYIANINIRRTSVVKTSTPTTAFSHRKPWALSTRITARNDSTPIPLQSSQLYYFFNWHHSRHNDKVKYTKWTFLCQFIWENVTWWVLLPCQETSCKISPAWFKNEKFKNHQVTYVYILSTHLALRFTAVTYF